jgi:hypothetical protein
LKISWDSSEPRGEEGDTISNLDVQAKKVRARPASSCLERNARVVTEFPGVIARGALTGLACLLFGAAFMSADAQLGTDAAEAKPIYRQVGAPAGRLTVTFPRSTGQLPDFYNFDPSRTHKYVDDDGKPLFPFGFGLSYTTFAYSHLAVQTPPQESKSDILVSIDVTNTGDEVAQLYIREDVSRVETPDRSLKGFSRIHLKPHETTTVTFHVPQDQLAIWNQERKWVVESGSYTVWAGGSSEASLTTKFLLHP